MTKQKFYELCIKKTFELAQDDEDSPYYEIANQIRFDESDTFDTLQVKLASVGFSQNIPEKEQFSVLKWKYIKQVLGFVVQNWEDSELVDGFFSCLKSNPSMINLENEEQDEIIYSLIIDNLTSSNYCASDFSKKLVDFYLTNRKKGKYLARVVSVAYAFGRTSLPLETLIKLKKANPLKI